MITAEQTSTTTYRSLLVVLGLTLGIGIVTGLFVVYDVSFLLLLALGGLLVTLGMFIRLEWGLIVLVFMVYTRFSDALVHYQGLPSILQPFMGLLLLIMALRWWLRGEAPKGWQAPALLLGAYSFFSFASFLYAADFQASQEAFISYVKDATIAILVVLLLQRPQQFRQVVWTLLLAGAFMGTISVFQHWTGTFTNTYGGFGQAQLKHIVGETNDYRVAGPVGDPNFYGQILVVLLPLALNRLWYEKSQLLRALAIWTFVVCLLSIIFTFSRGAFVAMVVVLALMMIRRPPNPLLALLVLALVLPLVRFVPDDYVQRIRTIPDALLGFSGSRSEEASLRGRTSEVTVGWLMFADHPVQGVGLENYPTYYQQYSRSLGMDQRRAERRPHNLYLQIASELGVLGLIAFGAILWGVIRGLHQAHQSLLKIDMPDYASLVFAFGVALVGYLVGALFLHAAFARYLWLLLGIGFAMGQVIRHKLQSLQR
ncbi:MAG TPA: O-antigen ligase family protein [Anaerolineae bacterium]